MLAVAQNGYAVGDRERLLQRVGDEYDGYVPMLQPLDQRKELMLLFWRQSRRRFVEDDHLCVVMNCARNLHHLLLACAKSRHDGGRIDVKIERLQKLLARDVDAAEAVKLLGVGQI